MRPQPQRWQPRQWWRRFDFLHVETLPARTRVRAGGLTAGLPAQFDRTPIDLPL
jgi:hypothetical protein